MSRNTESGQIWSMFLLFNSQSFADVCCRSNRKGDVKNNFRFSEMSDHVPGGAVN